MENTEKKLQRAFIMCGPSGSGKSTWLTKQMQPFVDICISRDNIRFMLLKDGEDYFAHEDRVRGIFYGTIEARTCETNWDNLFIDATHLTPKSRHLTTKNIAPDMYKIAVSFEVPVNVALARNAQRTGRALVPESVIHNMHRQYIKPTLEEGFDEIWHIDEEGNIGKEIRE